MTTTTKPLPTFIKLEESTHLSIHKDGARWKLIIGGVHILSSNDLKTVKSILSNIRNLREFATEIRPSTMIGWGQKFYIDEENYTLNQRTDRKTPDRVIAKLDRQAYLPSGQAMLDTIETLQSLFGQNADYNYSQR